MAVGSTALKLSEVSAGSVALTYQPVAGSTE